MSMKCSIDTIRNRNRDLPACSTVSQPTASTPPKPSTSALEPTQPPISGYRGYLLEENGRSLKLTTHLHLLTRLTMSADIHLFQLRTFRRRNGGKKYLYVGLLHEMKDGVKREIPNCFRRLRKIAKSNRLFASACPSVSPSACNSSAPTGRIFIKFEI